MNGIDRRGQKVICIAELENLPLCVDPDPVRTENRTRDMLIAEGRTAFRAGLQISRCPPFRDPDMRIDWQNGWLWERDGE